MSSTAFAAKKILHVNWIIFQPCWGDVVDDATALFDEPPMIRPGLWCGLDADDGMTLLRCAYEYDGTLLGKSFCDE